MAQQTIVTYPAVAKDSKLGTPIADAFKMVNDNFDELYAEPSISLVGNTLTLTRPDDTTSTVDLAPYLDEDARAISSGTLSGGIVTFTRDDASTFTLDLSGLLDDTNAVESVNGQIGVVVLDSDDITEGSTNLYDKTVALSEGSNISISGTYPNFTIAAPNLVTDSSSQALAAATSLSLLSNTLTLTKGDGTTDTVDLAPYLDEDARAIASGTIDGAGIVTFTRDDATTFTLDLSSLLDDTNLVTSVAGKAGVVTLVKGDVGLGNVDNTSDANKPISTATQTALNLKYDASNPAGYTSNVGDITEVSAGSGLTGGGTSGSVTVSHADTSTQSSVNNGGRTYIQDISLDTYGHITGITSATETVVNTDTIPNNATITLSAGNGLSGGGNFTTDQSGAETITFTVGVDNSTTELASDQVRVKDLGITTAKLANDAVTYAKMGTEFTTAAVISASNVDFSSAQVFTKTLSGATTLTFSNVSTGMVKDLVITGEQTLTLPASVKTISGTYDGTVSNLIQIVSTNGSTEQWATISQEA